KNTLEGSTPADRFNHFLNQTLSTPKSLIRFFSKYPLIENAIETAICFWKESISELAERLHNDKKDIEETFRCRADKIARIEWELSDSHKRGRSVAILTFSSEQKLVYKPRNIKIEMLYNSLLKFLNQKKAKPSLKTLAMLEKGLYGWVEYVPHSPCLDESAVRCFYEQSGAHLCLFYLLRGIDAHFENSIACGEHPVMIDCETLFMPPFGEPAEKKEKFSVLHTFFLPGIFPSHAQDKAKELGGFSMDPSDCSFRILHWVFPNTDEAHLAYEKKIAPAKHLPVFQEKYLAAKDYEEEIIRGFQNTYELFFQNQKEILKPGGLLERGKTDPIRVLMRNTKTYFNLLHRLTNPEFLSNPDLFEKELDQLTESMKGLQKKYLSVIDAEKTALRRGDIPIFYAYPGGVDLLGENYEPIVRLAFSSSPLQEAISCIQKMSKADEASQVHSIRDAFTALKSASHFSENMDTKSTIPSTTPLGNKKLGHYAVQIARTMLKRTNSPDEPEWYAMELIPSLNRFSFQKIGPNLYNGTAGIALFFAAIGSVLNDSFWKDKAELLLQPMCEKIKKGDASLLISQYGIGGMVGVPSFAYALSHTGRLLQNKSLQIYAMELICAISSDWIEEDAFFDLILGNAGLILILLSLYESNQNPEVLKKAILAGDHLIKHASDWGRDACMWKSEISKSQGLTGFSHGTAGIAYALLKLGHFSQAPRFKKMAFKAIQYERLTFSEEKQNWPDFRKSSYGMSWCHGAPGIGLGRVGAFQYLNDSAIREEIEIALQTTEQNFQGKQDHLCCGNFGRLELFRVAAPILQRKDLQEKTNHFASFLIEQRQSESEEEPFFKLGGGVYHPGFFTGMSGIGYTLLSLHDDGKLLPRISLLD
ncbi:MAG: type 2 lanthipeptide synthetase LanM family protein, partial [Chlamydiota bacterium]